MIEILKRSPKFSLKLLKRYYSMDSNPMMNYINGARVTPNKINRTIPKFSPITGNLMFDVVCSGPEEVVKAVNSAKQAQPAWSRICPRERGRILLSAASLIRSRIEQIAVAEVKDTGKPIWEARVDIAGCAEVLEYYGGIASTISGTHHQLSNDSFAMVQREPLGVVAGIGAWNYPFQIMTWKAAPALVCGNTFVYKPSEFTPTTSIILAEIFSEAGLPPGVVNIVQGGYETGEYLCAHEEIAKVTFTGSVRTGQKIVKSCADTMKRVTMELGGKSSLIVFQDSNLVNAVKATLLGNFLTQGEVCSNCTRVFVQNSILNEFTNKLVEATEKLKIGDPFHTDTRIGAIINEDHGKKILKYIDLAVKEGAIISCGGKRVVPKDPTLKGGFYISPCVLTHCNDDMVVAKEEIFGPVVTLLPFDCEHNAIARANASPFGLAAGIMTKDLQKAHRVASALQAGIVWINNYNVFPPEVPFGGYKLSGYGRENGMAAINDFSQLKTVYVEMSKDIDCPLYDERN